MKKEEEERLCEICGFPIEDDNLSYCEVCALTHNQTHLRDLNLGPIGINYDDYTDGEIETMISQNNHEQEEAEQNQWELDQDQRQEREQRVVEEGIW